MENEQITEIDRIEAQRLPPTAYSEAPTLMDQVAVRDGDFRGLISRYGGSASEYIVKCLIFVVRGRMFSMEPGLSAELALTLVQNIRTNPDSEAVSMLVSILDTQAFEFSELDLINVRKLLRLCMGLGHESYGWATLHLLFNLHQGGLLKRVLANSDILQIIAYLQLTYASRRSGLDQEDEDHYRQVVAELVEISL